MGYSGFPAGGYSTSVASQPLQQAACASGAGGPRQAELYFPAAGSPNSFHLQHGVSQEHGCRKGDACPFVHEASLVHPAVATMQDVNGGARRYHGYSPYGREVGIVRNRPRSRSFDRGSFGPSRTRDCRFFQQGRCIRGDACPFRHRSERSDGGAAGGAKSPHAAVNGSNASTETAVAGAGMEGEAAYTARGPEEGA